VPTFERYLAFYRAERFVNEANAQLRERRAMTD